MGRMLIVLLLTCMPTLPKAQEQPEFEEIDIILSVTRIGATDIPALIRGQDLYLSASDVFTFLKINNNLDENRYTLSGFILNPEDSFMIDKEKMIIIYQNQTIRLKPNDLIRSESTLYLKSNYWGEVFRMYCTFDFRSLSATMDSKIELPVFREMQQAIVRNNINKLKGEIKADSTIRLSHPLFKPGMLDWSASSAQQSDGKTVNKLAITTGTALAGGTAELGFNYQSDQELSLDNQHFLWKYANNDLKGLRQAMIGKINPGTISSFFKPAVGIQITNAPTSFRRSFGTYQLSDVTQPNWIVELYVNNILVDYTKADASGLFSFDIPLVYGSSEISLRFYGTWGEEQERKMNISIPFNFLPKKELEYTLSAGIVTDNQNSRLIRGVLNYGLCSWITIGGGAEYLSSIFSDKTIPFINASFRFGSGILLSGEYDYGVQTKTTLSYNIPSGFQAEAQYILYDKDQKAIFHSYLEDRKLSITIPARIKKKTLFSRMVLRQIILPELINTTGQLSLSAQILNISNNFTTYHQVNKTNAAKTAFTYSLFSQNYRLPARFNLSQQIQYEYNRKEFSLIKVELYRPIFKKSYISVNFEQDFRTKYHEAGIGFRTDFAFAQTAFSARRNSKQESAFSESAMGSFFYDGSTRHLGTNSRSSVGKGGLIILTFLDINGNETFDEGEPKIDIKNIVVNGGRVYHDEHDSVVRITDLEPYRAYNIELNNSSFDYIAWRLKNTTLRIFIDPNIMKVIEVPVSIVGEASGRTSVMNGKMQKGIGRINILLVRENGYVAAQTLTEGDGFFRYLGLSPGNYTAQVDTSQLRKIQMVALPSKIPFTIKSSVDGDNIEGLNFVLKNAYDSVIHMDESDSVSTKMEIENRIYFIQTGAFRSKRNATKMMDTYNRNTPYQVVIVKEKGLFKVRTEYFKTLNEANACHRWMQDNKMESIKGKMIAEKFPIKFILIK